MTFPPALDHEASVPERSRSRVSHRNVVQANPSKPTWATAAAANASLLLHRSSPRKAAPQLRLQQKPTPSHPLPPASDDSWSSSKSQPVRFSSGLSKINIATSNQSSETTSPVDPVSDTNQHPPKVPPIFLPGSAWRKVAPKLMSAVPADGIISKACDNNSIKLQCVDINLFRIVQKYLYKNCIYFHTVPSPIERTIKIIIRGLLTNITELEVSDELKSKGYDVKTIRQFGNASRKFPLHLVILAAIPSTEVLLLFPQASQHLSRHFRSNPSPTLPKHPRTVKHKASVPVSIAAELTTIISNLASNKMKYTHQHVTIPTTSLEYTTVHIQVNNTVLRFVATYQRTSNILLPADLTALLDTPYNTIVAGDLNRQTRPESFSPNSSTPETISL
ncbi:hypothetical protein ACI65C_001228 [Semiaphis heraclei]